MKIVDVNEFYAEKGGGVRSYVHQKLEHAARLGVDLTVIAPGPYDRVEARMGGRIAWVKGPPMPFDPRYYVMHRERAVHALLDDLAPDLIEGSSPWTAGWFAARYRANTPRAWVFHQDAIAVYAHSFLDRAIDSERIDRIFAPWWGYLRRLGRRYDATIVASEWLGARISAQGLPRATPVPFGIDRSFFGPSRRDESLRSSMLARVGLGPEATLLVGIGRHHPEKRIDTLIAAMRCLERDGGPPVGLVLFGDGPMRRRVERLAGRASHVHIAGFTDNRGQLADALASADAFLHGSAAETFGLVVAEALASGLPLVVPSAGGALDLADPRWAETYRPGDATACASAIRRLLSRPSDVLRRAARVARRGRVNDVGEHFGALFETYEVLASRGVDGRDEDRPPRSVAFRRAHRPASSR